MGRLFSDLERKIIETSDEVCRAALFSAGYEIEQDIMNEICYKIVDDYYDEYTPKKYKRMRSLYSAWDITTSLRGDRLHFHPTLDSDRLPQHYSGSQYHKSGSKWIDFYNRSDGEDNGIPDNGWILTNFFEGIHPKYYFSKKLGDVIDASEQFDGVVPKMGKYVVSYKKSGKLVKILAKHLKQQCKTYR